MLSDIVKGILAASPEIEVAEARRAGPAVPAGLAADVVIAGSRQGELPEPLEEALNDRPRMKVLTVLGDGSQTFLYELRPCRTALGEISPETLLEAVAGAKERPGG
jgi:hypothetical protein